MLQRRQVELKCFFRAHDRMDETWRWSGGKGMAGMPSQALAGGGTAQRRGQARSRMRRRRRKRLSASRILARQSGRGSLCLDKLFEEARLSGPPPPNHLAFASALARRASSRMAFAHWTLAALSHSPICGMFPNSTWSWTFGSAMRSMFASVWFTSRVNHSL